MDRRLLPREELGDGGVGVGDLALAVDGDARRSAYTQFVGDFLAAGFKFKVDINPGSRHRFMGVMTLEKARSEIDWMYEAGTRDMIL